MKVPNQLIDDGVLEEILNSPIPYNDETEERLTKDLYDSLSEEDVETAAQGSYAYWVAVHSGKATEGHKKTMALRECRRHLVGVKYEDAVKYIKETCKYRRDRRIDLYRAAFTDGITFEDEADAQSVSVLKKQIKSDLLKQHCFVRGTDKGNRALLCIKPRTTKDTIEEEYVSMLVYIMERAIAATEYASRGREEKILVVLDFGGFKSSLSPPISALKGIAGILQTKYSERLKNLIICDPPFWMRTLYGMIKPFLDPTTSAKFVVASGSKKKVEVISKHVDASQAMPWLLPCGQLVGEVDLERYAVLGAMQRSREHYSSHCRSLSHRISNFFQPLFMLNEEKEAVTSMNCLQLDAFGVPVVLIDPEGLVVGFNRQFVQEFNANEQLKLAGLPFESILAENKKDWQLCFQMCNETQQLQSCQVVAGCDTVQIRLAPYSGLYDGKRVSSLCFISLVDCQEITSSSSVVPKSVLNMDSDGAAAKELRQLIDTANAPIFGVDSRGYINEWNEKTAEVTGYSKEEAFGNALVDQYIMPDFQAAFQSVIENALAGYGTSNFELEFRTKSDEIRHLLINATTRRDVSNNIVGVVGVAQEVTESVQRDRAVASMALELRQLIDTANAPIFGIDVEGNINEWNRCTQEIIGYSREETFDEPLVERFIAPSMRHKVQEILEAALEGSETSNYELEFISKSGESRFMLVNATTRRDPDSHIVGVVGVGQDVTEDRKHAAELRRMQCMQATQVAKVETERNMTAYFAHELRNPLGAIDSALNAMPDDLPPAAMDLVSGMQLCSRFMSSIMNNLLDVRKMEEGKMTLTRQPLSLTSLVSGVQKMLLPAIKPGVTFESFCDTGDRDWVWGDEHRIQQILTNVVTNAIKYTISGSVTIRVGWEEEMVKFECVDTGPGIPQSEQDKIFERFVQRGGAPGSGLGLAIAKHLVDLAGGYIQFESDPTIRPGTTCIVVMPLELSDAPEVDIKEDLDHVIEDRLKLLIIDDVRLNRTMLARRITKGIAPNSEIQEACTGEEALEMFGQQTFDVVVVDQYMEEAGALMVGTDVVYAMRRMRIDSIIIGYSGNDLETEFKEAGADWFWKKPMPSNELIIRDLREALTKRRSQQEEQEEAKREP